TKIKLATLPKGELMVRHPHFTQPVFVRFPRPPVLAGPLGVQRFPPVSDVAFEEAVVRQLAALDRDTDPAKIKQAIAGHREEAIRRALLATKRTRPDNVLSFFSAALGPPVSRPRVGDSFAGGTLLKAVDDPYGT
ncbi:MAG: hypothetical protein AMS18_00915, partial [Gemmatimonas sp. SG8_17]